MQNQIENVCACGRSSWDGKRWRFDLPYHGFGSGPLCVEQIGEFKKRMYCPLCGCYLDDKGWAWRTVVLPEEPVAVWAGCEDGPDDIGLFTTEPEWYVDPNIDWVMRPDESQWEGEHYFGRRDGLALALTEHQKRRYYLIPVPQEGEDENTA